MNGRDLITREAVLFALTTTFMRARSDPGTDMLATLTHAILNVETAPAMQKPTTDEAVDHSPTSISTQTLQSHLNRLQQTEMAYRLSAKMFGSTHPESEAAATALKYHGDQTRALLQNMNVRLL